MTAEIHPSALVAPGARLGEGVRIGPFCVVGPDVTLGDGVDLQSHVVVDGVTTIGPRTRVWPFAAVGCRPQDLKFRGERSTLEIGADCMIRESATLHPGTEGGGGSTRVGDRCLIMVGAHVAHDCRLGDGVIMANNVTLAGHVEIGDGAVLGGLSAVHQFVRIGRGAMVGGVTGVEKDVIPYGSAVGDRARLAGLNMVGLKRRGLPRERLHALRAAYRAIFQGDGSLADRAAAAREVHAESPEAQEICAFILADSARSFCTPREA